MKKKTPDDKSKTSKKTSKKKSFYLTIYSKIESTQQVRGLSISKQNLNYYLKQLKQAKIIEMVGYGTWKVCANKDILSDFIVQKRSKNLVSNSQRVPPIPKDKKDYLRLHNLQIELLVTSNIHKYIKNLLFTKKTFKNIRQSGANKGHYFDVGNITYMVTQKKLFAFFPKNWEVVGDTISELAIEMYDQIKQEVNVLETRYKLILIKDGKICFNIRNIHIALVKNGIVKEFRKNNIKELVIYDEFDGKPRFIMDLSKGLPELEAIHPEKSFDDADEAKHFMENLKDGTVRDIIKNYGDVEEIKKQMHLLVLNLNSLSELQRVGLVNAGLLSKSYTKTQLQLEATSTAVRTITEILKPPKEPTKITPPDYIN